MLALASICGTLAVFISSHTIVAFRAQPHISSELEAYPLIFRSLRIHQHHTKIDMTLPEKALDEAIVCPYVGHSVSRNRTAKDAVGRNARGGVQLYASGQPVPCLATRIIAPDQRC